MSFQSLNLDARLLKAIEACHFTEPTDIQKQAIPVILQGRDLMASAQTGTGKTAAFVLPLLHLMLQETPVQRGPWMLVLTPTRELAAQVEDNVRQLGQFFPLKSATVVGGQSYPPQIKALQRPLDILVATPGRLLDHMNSGRISFAELRCLVLDEADRMLDMGFIDDIQVIARATPAARQTLLFSATLDGTVGKIARELLKNPERIALSHPAQAHTSIEQHWYLADDMAHKERLLQHFLQQDGLHQAVVFTATKRGADQLAQRLNNGGHEAAALHGDMPQRARQRTMERMRLGDYRILVATDVAARGLDIKGISHVVNFDMPMSAEDYTHRIGRTGRAGATGIAISLIGPQDRGKLSGIERMISRKITHSTVAGLEPTRSFHSNSPGGKPRSRSFSGRPGGGSGKFDNSRPRGKKKPTGMRAS